MEVRVLRILNEANQANRFHPYSQVCVYFILTFIFHLGQSHTLINRCKKGEGVKR